MSFQPPSGPPDDGGRTRSTQIPGDLGAPAPTAAEFLAAPPPGLHLAGSEPSAIDDLLESGRKVVSVAVLVVVLALIAAGVVAYFAVIRTVDDGVEAIDDALNPPASAPGVSLPDLPAPGSPPAGGSTISSRPGTPTTVAPNGAASTFQAVATAPIVEQLEAALPGEPTAFTRIVLYPSYVIATALRPDDQERLAGATWRNGVVDAGRDTAASPFDLGNPPFVLADVDWAAIERVVSEAPALVGRPDRPVTHVIVGRATDPGAAVVLRVYVEGITGGLSYVEASALGTVIRAR